MTLHATIVGTKVLAGLAKGRQRANEHAQARHAHWVLSIAALANQDHKPRRGMARRIRRRLDNQLSIRQINRILVQLFGPSHSMAQAKGIHTMEDPRYATK